MAETNNHEGRQRVYLTVHENFVREDIHYQDRKTGEEADDYRVTAGGRTTKNRRKNRGCFSCYAVRQAGG